MNPINTSNFKNLLKLSVLIVGLLIFFQSAYAQKNQIEKEVLDALTNFEKKDYQKSIPIFEKYQANLGLDDIFTLAITVSLHSYYLSFQLEKFEITKVNQAVDRYIERNSIGKAKNKKFDDILYLDSVIVWNKKNENYDKQAEYLSALKEFYDKKGKVKSIQYFSVVSELADCYYEQSRYRESKDLYEYLIPKEKNVLGDHHPKYLSSLDNLALAYLDLLDFNKTLQIKQKVVDLKSEIFGVHHPAFIESLSDLAWCYAVLRDYEKAVEIMTNVTKQQKETFGDHNLDYLTYLSYLASFQSSLDNNLVALEINQFVVDLRKKILGEHDFDYINSLTALAENYSRLEKYDKSLAISQKAVDLTKEILGERDPKYLKKLSDLAQIFANRGNYIKSLEVYQEVVDLGKDILGDRHPDYINSLVNFAHCYFNLEQYNKALEIDLLAVDLLRKVLGERHPYYMNCLEDLSLIRYHLGDVRESMELDRKVVLLRRDVLGRNHSSYLRSLSNLSLSEFKLSLADSALIHFQENLKIIRENMTSDFTRMTEVQRISSWKQSNYEFEYFPLFLENLLAKHPNAVGDAFDAVLFTKGLLLNTTRDFNELIAKTGNPEVISKVAELTILKLQIQRLLEKPIVDRYQDVDSLENITQKKETELIRLSKEYGDYTRNLKIRWKDVQSNLGEKDVAIEFVEYPTLTDTIKYAAFVLRKGWQYPRMIALFRKDQIQEFIKQDKDKIYINGYVGKQLKKLIWGPLEEVISEGDNVFFSASGILHQLAIENLPANDTQTLSEMYNLYRLSSTKELVLKKAPEKITTAVLYGGLQFDITNEKMLAESKKYEKKENLYAMRGYQSDSTLRKGWGFLEGTLTEVQQINQLMKDNKYKTTFFTGESGSEESFKSLSGKKEGIIHIATHGFFLPLEDTRKNLFMQQRMGDQFPEKPTADPMLRAGLMLSGGNRAWQGDTIPENIEDGVLTAKEISRMDLRGTDLVVLSACETGLGEVSSEGVFGLQRSFKQAGVQTLVMSLWEVSDKATNFMMTQFYTNLLSGKDKREAFLEAKKSCKENFPEPRYWAAFIMLD